MKQKEYLLQSRTNRSRLASPVVIVDEEFGIEEVTIAEPEDDPDTLHRFFMSSDSGISWGVVVTYVLVVALVMYLILHYEPLWIELGFKEFCGLLIAATVLWRFPRLFASLIQNWADNVEDE